MVSFENFSASFTMKPKSPSAFGTGSSSSNESLISSYQKKSANDPSVLDLGDATETTTKEGCDWDYIKGEII